MSEKEKSKDIIIEIKAVEDEDPGGSRLHFLLPTKPAGVDKARIPNITGAIWIKKGEEVPDKIIIVMPKKKGEASVE